MILYDFALPCSFSTAQLIINTECGQPEDGKLELGEIEEVI